MFIRDTFGNLVQVTEPKPGGGEVHTYYSYNLRDQLTQVLMTRNGTTQLRTFSHYQKTGRLPKRPACWFILFVGPWRIP